MFLDRVRTLEKRLKFPEQDVFDREAFSLEFLRSGKRYEMYWHPCYLTFSYNAYRNWLLHPIRHLYLFRFTTATNSFVKHDEFEELY